MKKKILFLFFLFFGLYGGNLNYNHQSQYGNTPFVISLGGISSPLFDNPKVVADNPSSSALLLREKFSIYYSSIIAEKQSYFKIPFIYSRPIPWGSFSIAQNIIVFPNNYYEWLSSTQLIFAKDLIANLHFGFGVNFDINHQNLSKKENEKVTTSLDGINLDLALIGKISMNSTQNNFDIFDFQYGISIKNLGWIPSGKLKEEKIFYKSMMLKTGISSLFMKIPFDNKKLETRFLFELNTSLPNDEFSPDIYFSSAFNFNLMLEKSFFIEKAYLNFATQIKPLRQDKQITFFSGMGIKFNINKFFFSIDYALSFDKNIGHSIGFNITFGEKDETPPRIEIDF